MSSVAQQPFISKRHGSLAYRRWPAEHERGCIVFLHGWGDHGGHYAGLAKQLSARGFSCWAPDFYGHGLSPGPRAKVHDFKGLVDDLQAFLESLQLGSPTFLCGHSMG